MGSVPRKAGHHHRTAGGRVAAALRPYAGSDRGSQPGSARGDHRRGQSAIMSDQLVRDYYRYFNERRLATAGMLFGPDAVVDMPPFVHQAHGPAAYAQFADTWLRAFPDALFTLE